ncbi:MAG: MFS transporter [Deltaproteobacteria bacterium]|nr:MFS transporter [Deltaproteobacteria bacterium]
MHSEDKASLFTPVLLSGCVILMVGFAIRASFGVFQVPIGSEFLWPRSEFSLAIAIQNIAWGIGQPIFSVIAEKWGDQKAVVLGAFVYAVGLVLSSYAVTPEALQILEILVGFGIAGTGFGVILAVVGRSTCPENRSLALGIATAAGSAGQIVGPPIASWLLGIMPWSEVFLVFAVSILFVLVVLPFLRAKDFATRKELEEGLLDVCGKALKDPSYIMIFLGFFSCGFQLAFITAHFPALVEEMCIGIPQDSLLRSIGVSTTSALGAFSIAVIGMANLLGTIAAGALGKYFPKKNLLSLIYTGRTIAAAVFIMMPITSNSVLLFSTVMGGLWLATVPLTSGLVAHIYGLKYMGTLYGLVFLSHQLGGFSGVWLGGLFYDEFGSYDIVWWVGVGVGAFSAIVHLPVREQPLLNRVAVR